MSKFKVGDRVKVVKYESDTDGIINGEVGIVRSYSNEAYRVELDVENVALGGFEWILYADEIEAVC